MRSGRSGDYRGCIHWRLKCWKRRCGSITIPGENAIATPRSRTSDVRDFMNALRASGITNGGQLTLAARSSAFAAELDKWWLESQRKNKSCNEKFTVYSFLILAIVLIYCDACSTFV